VAATHRVYARALFEAARGEGRTASVRAELADFVAAADEVPELGSLLRNPQLDPRVRKAAIGELLGDADPLVRNFLLLVVEKGRAGELEPILAELEALVAAEQGRLTVELTTAVELTEEETGQILRQIEDASGRTLEATRRVDPDLIGGIVLQAGSLRVDASVRGRLNRLRDQLATKRS
jgi:F-type H+-transporting ATPase subunit delta